MNETPRSWFNQLIVILMGTVGLLLITRALHGLNTKEGLRMIAMAARCAIIVGMTRMGLNRLTRVKKVYASDQAKPGRFDKILIGGVNFIQLDAQPKDPTTTLVVVIVIVVVLFFVCPYLIGRILTEPEWTEEEEAMGAEFPSWDASDNWAELFPRNYAQGADASNRSKVSPEK